MSLKDRAYALREASKNFQVYRKQTATGALFMGPKDPWDEDTDVSGKTPVYDHFAALFDEQVKAAKKKMEEQPNRGPFTWLEPVCDCGGDKLKTTHYEWCSKAKRRW